MAKAAFTNELKEVFIDDDPPCANVLLRWPSKGMNRLAQRRARASRVQPRKEIDMKAFLALALISIATIADARRGPVPQPVPGCHWVMRTNGSFYLVCG
jgi:hypothetical protein